MEKKTIVNDKTDLFGNTINTNKPIRDKFIEPPFTILDTTSGPWLTRKRAWGELGIKSELGRDVVTYSDSFSNEKYGRTEKDSLPKESIFDPALCEVMYNWFCPQGGTILDCFAGGSVRGVVANYLGFKYTGIDIRPEQIESNIEQGLAILGAENVPKWIAEDSNVALDKIDELYDFGFSCPPYADLEVYSDLPGDISNMDYYDFLRFYRSIIKKFCAKIKPGGFVGWVIGEVRDKKTGEYYGLVPDTIDIFRRDCGMAYWNEAVLKNSVGTAMLRANNTFSKGGCKLVKTHQTILVFKKRLVEFTLE